MTLHAFHQRFFCVFFGMLKLGHRVVFHGRISDNAVMFFIKIAVLFQLFSRYLVNLHEQKFGTKA